jgi:hypothetical protein
MVPPVKIVCGKSETVLHYISCMMSNIIQVLEAGRMRWFRHCSGLMIYTEQKIKFFYLRNYQRNRDAKYMVVGQH